MAARTGKQYLAGLKDDRAVWVGDDRVADVTTHSALSGGAKSLAGMFDLQHEQAAICLMPDPETGEPISVSHMLPRSKEDVKRRHDCLRAMAEYSVGLMGRSPDYLNVTFAGFAAHHSPWRAAENDKGADRLIVFQKEMARRDIAMTHTIIHPTTDRALGDSPQPGNDVSLAKVGETSRGIVVRGARILATLAPFSDEISVYPSHPLQPGSEAYALAFSIPVATPGLKFLCRDSYSSQASRFDHPLSSRFDEEDAFVIFDEVEVPWERVFLEGNLAVYNTILRTSWAPNIMQQTTIRAHTKLEFAHELATRIAEAVNDTRPQTQQMLGEIWSYAELCRSAILAAEDGSHDYGDGAWFPDHRPFTALRAALPTWFPRVNEIIQLIGSHNLLAVPSSGQLADPSIRPLIDKYMRGAGEIRAEERARLNRLAWDFTGSALANRIELYERFYLASGPRNYQIAHAMADRTAGARLLEGILRED